MVIKIFLFLPQSPSGVSETRLAQGFLVSLCSTCPSCSDFCCFHSLLLPVLSLKFCLEDEIKHPKKPNPKSKQNPLDPKPNQNPGNDPACLQVLIGAKSSFDTVCTLLCINVYLGFCFLSKWKGGTARTGAVTLLESCWEFDSRECLCSDSPSTFSPLMSPLSVCSNPVFRRSLRARPLLCVAGSK